MLRVSVLDELNFRFEDNLRLPILQVYKFLQALIISEFYLFISYVYHANLASFQDRHRPPAAEKSGRNVASSRPMT